MAGYAGVMVLYVIGKNNEEVGGTKDGMWNMSNLTRINPGRFSFHFQRGMRIKSGL